MTTPLLIQSRYGASVPRVYLSSCSILRTVIYDITDVWALVFHPSFVDLLITPFDDLVLRVEVVSLQFFYNTARYYQAYYGPQAVSCPFILAFFFVRSW